MPPFEALLAKLRDAALQAHPGIEVSQAEFIAEMKRRLGDQLIEQVVYTCSTNDIYVMIAASRGDARAVEYVEAQLARVLEAAGPSMNATPPQIDEARGVVRELVFTDTYRRVAVAKTYDGRGDLRALLREIVTRELSEIVQRG